MISLMPKGNFTSDPQHDLGQNQLPKNKIFMIFLVSRFSNFFHKTFTEITVKYST